MSVQLGANTKDHRAKLFVGKADWGEFEELPSPEISLDGEVRFRIPGSAFESSGGGVYTIEGVEGQRHWKYGRDEEHEKTFIDAATKAINLEGTISWYQVQPDGTLSSSPRLTCDCLIEKFKGPDANSGSEDAMLEIGLSIIGAPRAGA